MKDIYTQARRKSHATLAFKLTNGRGSFVFMMFFSDNDRESKDKLYIFLVRTSVLIEVKLYGKHLDGQFEAYFKEQDKKLIRKELGLVSSFNPFSFERLLSELNSQIPQSYSFINVAETLRQHKDILKDTKLKNIIDEASKIYLIGPKQLPEDKKPRENTLRKLSLYVQADLRLIEKFINILKKHNCTLAWTADPERQRHDILAMMRNIDTDL
ncbi:MAG TPA: hypothetical protein VFS88_04180 [Micavibrio sp.]|nr:hypothetical protein [Micavibrio sp.]